MKKHYNWGGWILVLSILVFYMLTIGLAVWDSAIVLEIITFDIITLAIVIPISIIIFKGLSRNVASKNAFATLPEITSETEVSNKSKKTVGSRYSTRSVFYVTFEFPDGERKSFQVNHEVCATTDRGDFGTLTYKEGNNHRFFVSFKRKKVN